MAHVRSVNVSLPVEVSWVRLGRTSIDRRPVRGRVRAGQLGLEGDQVANTRYHGGPDQAVYAYSREDLDFWADELGADPVDLRDGQFGENLTTTGMDLNAAQIGERWQVGSVLLEVASVRTPCATFKAWQHLNGFDSRRWSRRFVEGGRSGAYLRVLEHGALGAGDEIHVVHRPGHGITVRIMFRALTTQPVLLPRLLDIEGLAAMPRREAERYVAKQS